jgi:hypothetical protein
MIHRARFRTFIRSGEGIARSGLAPSYDLAYHTNLIGHFIARIRHFLILHFVAAPHVERREQLESSPALGPNTRLVLSRSFSAQSTRDWPLAAPGGGNF